MANEVSKIITSKKELKQENKMIYYLLKELPIIEVKKTIWKKEWSLV